MVRYTLCLNLLLILRCCVSDTIICSLNQLCLDCEIGGCATTTLSYSGKFFVPFVAYKFTGSTTNPYGLTRARLYYLSCGTCTTGKYWIPLQSDGACAAALTSDTRLDEDDHVPNIAPNTYCRDCTACTSPKVVDFCEGEYGPGKCTCDVGYSTEACSACAPGTYKNQKGTMQCTQCPLGTYQDAQGQASCKPCGTQTISSGKVVQTYASLTGSSVCSPCLQWSSESKSGRFFSPCTATSNFLTVTCTLCPSGKYMDKDCNGDVVGRVFTEAPACLNCQAGTFSVAISGGLQTFCTLCSTGSFQDAAGQSSCKTCSVGLLANSQFGSWGSTVPSSNGCPVSCNAGYFKRSSPARCEACATGKHSSAGATVCQSCTGLPANAKFLPTVRTERSNYQCVWDCNSGYQKTSSKTGCQACTSGYFSVQARADENTPEITCATCTPCTEGVTFQSRPCSTSQNRVCSYCKSTCGAGKFISTACSVLSDAQCTSCKTACQPNYRLVDTCPGTGTEDIVKCEKCTVPQDCLYGVSYLPQICPGTDRIVRSCVACASPNCVNSYAKPCNSTQNALCVPYTSCPSNYFLANFGQAQDGVCMPCTTCPGTPTVACTQKSDALCVGTLCNSTHPCPRREFCKFVSENDLGYCAKCPRGYDSDGLQCKACPNLETCDEQGRVVCRGQLLPFSTGQCFDGFVRETGTCPAVTSSLFVVRRGGYIFSADSNCYPYFECTPGHVYFYSTSDATVQCTACIGGGVHEQFLSRGLQADNSLSCISDCRYGMYLDTEACKPPPSSSIVRLNGPGQFFDGVFLQTCPSGFTSQRGLALSSSDCVQCEPVQHTIGDLCGDYACTGAWHRRGAACYTSPPCPAEGLDEACVVSPLPWQPAGRYRTGWTAASSPPQSFQQGLLWIRQGTYILSINHGITNRHKLFVPGRTIVLPGAVCSATHRDNYVFLAFCEASFVVFYTVTASTPRARLLIGRNETGYREDYKTEALFGPELYISHHPTQPRLFVIDKFNCVLREIVATTPGHYLTRSHLVYGVPNMCFGPNSLQWPRGLFPVLAGSLFFFASEDGIYQLHTHSMRVRRALLRPDALLVQNVTAVNSSVLLLHFVDRTESLTATSSPCRPGSTSLFGGDCVVPCPLQLYWVNQSTGACTPCFTHECGVGEESVECTYDTPQYCAPCPALPSASARYFLPGSCSPTNVYYVNPCPKNMYLREGTCASCPPYSETVYSGAVSQDECRCFEGVQRVAGSCVVGQLYQLPFAPKCDLLTYPRGLQGACESCRLHPLPTCLHAQYTLSDGTCGACQSPANSTISGTGVVGDDPTSCPWSCNVGFYPDNAQPFHTRCQPCTSLTNHSSAYYTTNGQDDAPKSCIWLCSYPYTRRLQECVVCDYKGSLPSCRNPLLQIACPACTQNVSNVSGVLYRFLACPVSTTCTISISHLVLLDLLMVGPGGSGGLTLYDAVSNTSTRGAGGGGAGEVYIRLQAPYSNDVSMRPGSPSSSFTTWNNAITLRRGGGGGGGPQPNGGLGGSGGGAGVGGTKGFALGTYTAYLNNGGMSNSNAGGGGGGSTSVGGNPSQNRGGDGGDGLDVSWFVGYNMFVAGGGAGSPNLFGPNPIAGKGKAGGGDPNQDGAPYTGSGGGGGMLYLENGSFRGSTGGLGGSGLTLVRFVDVECKCEET